MRVGEEDIAGFTNVTSKLTTGEEVTFQWEIERQPITFNDTKEFPVKILRNGKLVSYSMYTIKFIYIHLKCCR
jgi:hypothetical protein